MLQLARFLVHVISIVKNLKKLKAPGTCNCLIPVQAILLALTVSGGITALLTIIAIIVINRARDKARPKKWSSKYLSLSEAIKSIDEFPSLANLQVFMWSVIIVFAFLTVYLVRVSGGVFDPPAGILPENILKILGISAVVPAASLGLNSYKYGTAHAAYIDSIAVPLASSPTARRFRALYTVYSDWSSILLEGGSSSITRLQMFVWTWIGIFIYLTVFFGYLYTLTLPDPPPPPPPPPLPNPYNEVSLPDIDPTLVVLMGISQGSFVAGKVVSPKFS
jgi:hypothetical protein